MTDQLAMTVPLLCIVTPAVVRQPFAHELVSENPKFEGAWRWLVHHRYLVGMICLRAINHCTTNYGSALNRDLIEMPLTYLFKGLCPKQTIALIPNIINTQNTVPPLQTRYMLHISLLHIPVGHKAYSRWSLWQNMGCFNDAAVQRELW